MKIKNNIFAVSLVLVFLVALPIETKAFSLNLRGNSEVKLNNSINSILGDGKGSNNVEIKTSHNISKDTEKDDRDERENKSEISVQSKNDVDVNSNRRFWGWLMGFLKRDENAQKPLKITGEHILTATSTTTIIWKTNVEASGYVKFNADKNLVASSTKVTENTSLDLGHKITLTGLSPNTTYYLIIGSTDGNDNNKETKIIHFKTKKLPNSDSSLLKILFSGSFKIEATSANVIWITSKPTTAKIWLSSASYVNTSLAPVVSSTELSYFHNLVIADLATSTKYFYIVGGTDISGNVILASENSLETEAI